MKLSEAIRLGAMIRPQSHVASFIGGKSCAQGAAAEACGMKYKEWASVTNFLLSQYPWAENINVPLPCGCTRDRPLIDSYGAIAHLNDHMGNHRWTREQIADWVATIEPQDSPVTEPTSTQELSHAQRV